MISQMDLDVNETIDPIFQSKLKTDTSHASPKIFITAQELIEDNYFR